MTTAPELSAAPAVEAVGLPSRARQFLAVARHSVADRWRLLLGWGAALVAMAVLQLSVYPSVAESAVDMQQFVEQWPEALQQTFSLDQYATGTGFLNAELFTFMVPLTLIAVALGVGAAATAGEEERGTADLLFSLPLPRWLVVLAKTAAMVVCVAAIALAGFVALWIGAPLVDLDVTPAGLAAVTATLTLLALVFGGIALLTGATTGSRAAALGAGTVAALAAFLLHALGGLADWLEPWQEWSPFHWALAPDPLANGVDWGAVTRLLVVFAALVVLSVAAFHRRDLSSR